MNDSDIAQDFHRETCTTCPYCGVGCGVRVRESSASQNGNKSFTVTGDDNHPANYGALCSKGSDLAATLSADDRLTDPLVDGSIASWDHALDHIAERFQQTIEAHGPESVAFYVSGQLLTEDYYVVNKLVKGYIGSANIDTNSRLCMSSTVAGHKRAFGSDTVPGCYEDLELADLIVLSGSNLAWCHPILYQRIRAAKKRRPKLKVIVIDPRQTATCDLVDSHLCIRPDTDADLFNGLLGALADGKYLNKSYIAQHTENFAATLKQARALNLKQTSATTGLSTTKLRKFYHLFAETERVVTVFSQGINQSTRGTDTVNSIINCHLATGRIGQPGMGPFSVTGQPNAMGGREVGGLANMLAAHMDLDNPTHRDIVQTFWQSPRIASKPGRKAVDLFNDIGAGKIKALWIMATNPVDSMPQAGDVAQALSRCPFVVVSDIVSHSDTQAYAHVRLPALAWGEKDGTVTNSERRISRQRAFKTPTGNAKPDWWAVCEVAKRLGYEKAFDYPNAATIFREHSALSGFRNAGSRDFDIGHCAQMSDQDYDSLQPFQWPWRTGERHSNTRFFADGPFYTPSGKARFVPVLPPQSHPSSPSYPLLLNTGRIRDQWHTMTRTGHSARLSSHLAEPFIEIHPEDAARHDIAPADIVRVRSANNHVLVRALLSPRAQRGVAFMPMHWSDQFSSRSRINTLISGNTDPISGQPASKSEPISMSRFDATHYGFCIVHDKLQPLTEWFNQAPCEYWAKARCDHGYRIEFAGTTSAGDLFQAWQAQLSLVLERADALADDSISVIQYRDKHNHRAACFYNDTLLAAVFIDRQPVMVSRYWSASLLAEKHSEHKRHRILAAQAAADQPDKGAIVCSCFMVGSHQIAGVASRQERPTVESIGDALSAGTNCGSCRSEIGQIIKAVSIKRHTPQTSLPSIAAQTNADEIASA